MSKGVATIWILLIITLLVAAASAGYMLYAGMITLPGQSVTPSPAPSTTSTPTSPTQSQDSNPEEPFTLVGEIPYGTGQVYKGYVILEGEYSLNKPYQLTYGVDPNTLGGYEFVQVFFDIDSQFESKMPQAFGKPVQIFALAHRETAITLTMGTDRTLFNDKTICKLSGRAKIAVTGLNLLTAETEGFHRATLAKVFSTTKPTVEKC